MIPTRTRKQIFVRVANPDIRYGYVPKLDVGPQVYLGNAVVSNHEGIAPLYVINSMEEDIELAIPTVKLHPFEEMKIQEPINSEILEALKTKEERVKRILQLLRLDHLNKEEEASVVRLITEHADRFQLSEESLEVLRRCRNTEYSLPTTDHN